MGKRFIEFEKISDIAFFLNPQKVSLSKRIIELGISNNSEQSCKMGQIAKIEGGEACNYFTYIRAILLSSTDKQPANASELIALKEHERKLFKVVEASTKKKQGVKIFTTEAVSTDQTKILTLELTPIGFKERIVSLPHNWKGDYILYI